MADYSYLVLYLPRGMSRDAARRILTDHAEYGGWELAKLRLYPDGSRKATLRRPIIRPGRLPIGLMPIPAAAWLRQQTGPPGLAGGPVTFP